MAGGRPGDPHDERQPDDRRESRWGSDDLCWLNAKGRSERDTFAAGALKRFERRRAISVHQLLAL